MFTGIFYVSKAKVQFVPENLIDLASQSARRNADLHVTGALVHLSGRFLQYIEGPLDEPRRLMAKIAADPRHRVIRSVENEPIEQRKFPEWSMQLLERHEGIAAGIASLMFSPMLAYEGSLLKGKEGEGVLEEWDGLARSAINDLAALHPPQGP